MRKAFKNRRVDFEGPNNKDSYVQKLIPGTFVYNWPPQSAFRQKPETGTTFPKPTC